MENKILDLFLYSKKLKFGEMEKKLDIRSNKLAYHLKRLINNNILNKEGDSYEISDKSESILPYLSDKKSVLPVILIHIGTKKECFLYTRKKRPYAGYLSLPGGRMLLGESIKQAVKRIMFDKFRVKSKLIEIHSVSLEQVKYKSKIVNSFLLIFVTAQARGLEILNLEKNKRKIIRSDLKLLTENLSRRIVINTINSYF